MRVLIVATVAPAGPATFVAKLAERCDAVFAADGGGAVCLSAGVTPSLVVGDLDSLTAEDERRLREAGARFVTVAADKDVTDLDLALDEARRADAREIWVTGALGGRLDHTLATIGSLARSADMRPRVLETHLSAWLLAPEGENRLTLRGKGALVSLFALGGAATVSCEGFRYGLSRETLLPLGSRGLSNLIAAEQASIEVFDGCVLVLSLPTNGMQAASDEELEWIRQ